MTKMFGNLSTEGVSEATDRSFGGRGPFDAGVYDATVKLAYGTRSPGGANAVVLHLDIDGREHRETVYFTKKTGETFYVDKKDNKTKHPMPGFTVLNDLCLMTSDTELLAQDFEDKIVNLYDFDAKKEVPTTVPVMMGVLGKKIKVGLLQEISDKEAKGTDGVYRPTGETRTQNRLDKVFHPETSKTVPEYRAGIAEAAFIKTWLKDNEGQTRNTSKGAEGKTGTPGAAGGSPATASGMFGGGAAQPAQATGSMFGNR